MPIQVGLPSSIADGISSSTGQHRSDLISDRRNSALTPSNQHPPVDDSLRRGNEAQREACVNHESSTSKTAEKRNSTNRTLSEPDVPSSHCPANDDVAASQVTSGENPVVEPSLERKEQARMTSADEVRLVTAESAETVDGHQKTSEPLSEDIANAAGRNTREDEISLLRRQLDLVEEQLKAFRETLKINTPDAQGKSDGDVDDQTYTHNGHASGGSSSRNTEQTASILRVSGERWREYKKGSGIRTSENVLIASSGGFGSSSSSIPSVEGQVKPSKIHGYESPYRLAINSFQLLEQLNGIMGADALSDSNNVWVRPFKYLMHHERDIRRALEDSQEKCKENKQDDTAAEEGKAKGVATPQHQREEAGRISLDAKAHDITDGESSKESQLTLEEEKTKQDEKPKESLALRDHLRCLVEFLDTDMEDIFPIRKQIANRELKEIAFENLLHLYKPGDLIFTSDARPGFGRRAYRVLHVTGGRHILDKQNHSLSDTPLRREEWETEDKARGVLGYSSRTTPVVVDCFGLDFDGTTLGPVPKRFIILEYSGTKPILSLEAFPAGFDPEQSKVTKMLAQRGLRFLDIVRKGHKHYTGMSLIDFNMNRGHQEELNSEVMVDHASAMDHFIKQRYPYVLCLGDGVIESPTRGDRRETYESGGCNLPGCTSCCDVVDDSRFDVARRNEYMHNTTLLDSRKVDDELTEDHLVLLPARVFGYALLNRKWYPLNIDHITEIQSGPSFSGSMKKTGFEDLVLPEEHKKLIKALVKNQMRTLQEPSNDTKLPIGHSMDLVKGKGKGLIILLHGAPGVGKTSTAECVAAQLRRPLLPITCGDLGSTAKDVEVCLEDYFTLAHRWGCVLLLDEADVFLAQRERGDIKRNSLVSVFLRILEYYPGVLILTTNRVGQFDEAFKSRIHVSIYYPRLDEKSTSEIWEMNLRRIQNGDHNVHVCEDEIRRFYKDHWKEHQAEEGANYRWNGRQIKNAFQTALALANWDFYDVVNTGDLKKPVLTADHFHIVAQTSADFDTYIRKLYFDVDDDDEAGLDTHGRLALHDRNRNDAASGRRHSKSPLVHADGRFAKTLADKRGDGDRGRQAETGKDGSDLAQMQTSNPMQMPMMPGASPMPMMDPAQMQQMMMMQLQKLMAQMNNQQNGGNY